MGRVMHFEIQAEKPERAIQFYTGVFGWKITRWGGDEYWLITTGRKEEPGIDGGENVVPRIPIPTVGWLAYCRDTEGNILGVMHADPGAK